MVADFVSLAVLLRELGILYERGTPDLLGPAPAVQFVDWVRGEAERLAGEDGRRMAEHWREELAGSVHPLDLPTDRRRPPVQSFLASACPFRLGSDLAGRLRSLARDRGATLYVALLSAFQTLLARYTGMDDLLVGSPVAGRLASEVDGVVGYFVNPVALRARLAGDPRFAEHLTGMRRTVLGALEYQGYPFALLAEQLEPVRNPGRSPLIQAMFLFQPSSRPGQEGLAAFSIGVAGARVQAGGLELEAISLLERRIAFDLLLSLAEDGGGLVGELAYATDLFERATVERMVAHYERLLEGVVASPQSRVSELPLLGSGERQQVLWEWNDSTHTHAEDQCLHWLFEAQVDRTPDRVAVVFGEVSLTYRDLDVWANQVARALCRRGVGPEVLVGLCLERSLEMVVGLYGILKSGGAYVPLDPEYPQERLLYMLADAGVSVVVTQGRYRELFAESLCLDEDREEIGRESRVRPQSGVCGDNAAYVMYTSGSTGRPKGAVIRHAGIASHMQWMQRDFPMGPDDSVIQKTPISFDASVWEFHAPLYAGGRLVMARPGGHRDPAYLAQEISRRRVTTLQVVPSLLRAFLEEPGVEGCRDLRWLICGGESMDGDLAHRFFARLPGELVNVYGPAESSITASFWFCGWDEPSGSPVTIGRAIANVQIHVLGRRLELLPVGIPGELCIGGVGVGRGYLGRPHLTAEHFVPDPFRGASGSRMYRTGDLVRRLADGRLEFLSRVDHQVKVRGVRIELGEVESMLLQHPQVQQAVALVREDAPGDRRLVGYVVSRGPGLEERALRSYLQGSLPEYMMPSALMVLESLPLNPSGKIDRSALPVPVLHVEEEYVAPRTPVEQAVASIWSEVLGVEKVGIEDNFFSLGGHSLLATRIVSRIRQTFSVELPLRELFESPTVASVAESIEVAQWSQESVPTAVGAGEDREELEL
jgi:amino acid adenylation domain-containing protein